MIQRPSPGTWLRRAEGLGALGLPTGSLPSPRLSKYNLGHICNTHKKSVVYLIFRFDWESCLLPGHLALDPYSPGVLWGGEPQGQTGKEQRRAGKERWGRGGQEEREAERGG